MTASKIVCHNEEQCLFSNADTALTVWGYVGLNELWLYETRWTLEFYCGLYFSTQCWIQILKKTTKSLCLGFKLRTSLIWNNITNLYTRIKWLQVCSNCTHGCILDTLQIFWEAPKILVHIYHTWVLPLLVYMNTAGLLDHKCLNRTLQEETVLQSILFLQHFLWYLS